MKPKLLLCLALVLGGVVAAPRCDAAIIYPKEPEGGRQMAMRSASEFVEKNLPPFQGIGTTNELTFAPPFREYGAGDLARGQLLVGAASGRDGRQMWKYTFINGARVVGETDLEVDEKTGKPLKCNGIGSSVFMEEIPMALQAAEQWPQVKKQDYEPRLLDDFGLSFVAIWLHGQSNDIIIPLPPTYNRMNAYQPYSESQIIRILEPEAKRDIAMWAKLDRQQEHDNNAYAEAMTDYEKAHGNQCGSISFYGMSAPFQELGPHVQIFTLLGKCGEGGELQYKVKVTFEGRFEGVKNVEILEKLAGKSP